MPASSFVVPGLEVAWRPSSDRVDADRLLSDLVASSLGAPQDVGRHCRRCGSTTHGRPVVEGAQMSLSRADGLVVAAISTIGEVGVDVERAGSAAFEGFEAVALHPSEEPGDPTLTWVRKEALLKATGWGLAIDPRRVLLAPDGRLLAWTDELPDPSRVWSRDLPVPQEYVATVAVIAPPEA